MNLNRQALRVWVQPQLERAGAGARARLVGQRLSYLLAEATQLSPGRTVTVSKVAEWAGYSHGGELEEWFAGEVEPSFADLDRLAAVFGCARAWLVHGDGQPYRGDYARIPEEPRAAVEFLLQPPTAGAAPPEILLLRSTAPAGDFAFVRRYGELSAQSFRTPYRLSAEVGGGGQACQAWLALGLQALYQTFTKRSDIHVKGYLVDEAVFNSVLEGRKHPLNALDDQRASSSTWWEDLGDPTQRGHNRYWDGWDDLVARIDGHIASNRAMADARAQLRGEAV